MFCVHSALVIVLITEAIYLSIYLPTLNPDPNPTLTPDPNPDAKCNSNINK